jgi:predicted transcriptional regulator YdeE
MKLVSTIKRQPAFKIVGISVRTTNQDGQAKKDIGTLFAGFLSLLMPEQIPGRLSPDIYCIYTEYESDFNGPYTCIVGCRVHSLENIPDGFVGINIAESAYRVYKSVGNLAECVADTWVQIWQSDINRKYAADFDIYGEGAMDPENAEVDIYVSII